jgi:hypothetical protein
MPSASFVVVLTTAPGVGAAVNNGASLELEILPTFDVIISSWWSFSLTFYNTIQ